MLELWRYKLSMKLLLFTSARNMIFSRSNTHGLDGVIVDVAAAADVLLEGCDDGGDAEVGVAVVV